MWRFVRNLFKPKSRGIEEYFAYLTGRSEVAVVSESTALKIAAIYSVVDRIITPLAAVPFNVYERTGDGRRLAEDHDQFYLIKREPSRLYGSTEFRRRLLASKLIWGNGYARIIRERGRPVEYQIIHPSKVRSITEIEGELWYDVDGELIGQDDIIHLKDISDGWFGLSRIKVLKSYLESAENSVGRLKEFSRDGFYSKLAVKLPSFLKDKEAVRRLQQSWNELYAGNRGPIILEGGADIRELGLPPEDLKILETIEMSINSVARVYNVPLYKLGIMEGANYSNIVQMNNDFVTYTLMPEAVQLEEEFNRKIFRTAERGRYFVKVELNGLMRGTIKERLEYYRTMRALAALNANEIRSLEELNPIEGGELYAIQSGFIPLKYFEKWGEKMTNEKALQNGQNLHQS